MKENLVKDGKWLGVTALVSAGVASLCCIGPAVSIALGLGSLGAFAAFERYRLLFMGLAAVVLGAAFYFTYRKSEAACADGSCKTVGESPKAKAALWVITVVAAAFMSAPSWLAALNGRGKSSADRLAPGAYRMVALSVEGMTCGACAVSIERALRKVPGVKAVEGTGYKAEVEQ